MKTLSLLVTLFIISSCASRYIKTETGLQYVILKKGKGDKAEIGDEILLYETTSYRNGTVLYSNENSGNPIKIKIGAGQVTNAVDEGLQGMRPREIRKLIAPPDLVKRTFYPENVSPDSTLVIKLRFYKNLSR
jgi:FKBP-type peptidyl-prolyl cis-trans isomerase